MEFRDLKRQYQVLKPQMDAAMLEVAQNCNFISGKQVAELEQIRQFAFAVVLGVEACNDCYYCCYQENYPFHKFSSRIGLFINKTRKH